MVCRWSLKVVHQPKNLLSAFYPFNLPLLARKLIQEQLIVQCRRRRMVRGDTYRFQFSDSLETFFRVFLPFIFKEELCKKISQICTQQEAHWTASRAQMN